MTSVEFVSWAEGYCKVFGLSNEEAETVLSWEPYFLATQWHADDLAEVTKAFVANPKKIADLAGDSKYLGKMAKHLSAIESYVRDQSACTLGQTLPVYADKHGSCLVCRNTGFVVVPHLKSVRAGRWVGVKNNENDRAHMATCAVLCSCALGRWKANRESGTRHGGKTVLKHMTLETYEGHNPGWREQVESWEASRTERLKLYSGGEQVKALAERLKMRRA